MLGNENEFYHGLFEKYTALFGTLFNDIYISRFDATGTKVQDFKVPLGYGPREKFLERQKEDGSKQKRQTAITFPRISYELISMNFAPERIHNPTGTVREFNSGSYKSVYNPVPYDLIYQVSIIGKNIQDTSKIVEQIIPHFKPNFSVTAHLVDNMPEFKKDISIVLNNVTLDDPYEGDLASRRNVVWTLDFTVKAYFFGLVTTPKVIKFAKVNLYPNTTPTFEYSRVTTYPGLTANGEPTTDPSEAIDWKDVDEDDNWAYIVIKEDAIEEDDE